jgi:NAD kinase
VEREPLQAQGPIIPINEVALFRQTHQAARLRILIEEHERMPELIADGVLVATPGGVQNLSHIFQATASVWKTCG